MTVHPRIISLLPSATEMICAMGLSDQLVGVTHECDYPPSVRLKPRVVRSVLPTDRMSEREIDEAVSERLRAGLGLYELDYERIRCLAPDIIVTQSLCEVCAPSQNDIAQLLPLLDHQPRLIFQTPRHLADVLGDIEELGRETGREVEAAAIVGNAQARIEQLSDASRVSPCRPRVFCMEWLEPPYCSGHWVPEMVRLAGGEDRLGREGMDSVRLDWREVVDWAPEILLFMPCGYGVDKAFERLVGLTALPGFWELPAAQTRRVFALDANSYFARPGPRVIDGAELIAHLIDPGRFSWDGPADAYRRLALPTHPARSSTEALPAT